MDVDPAFQPLLALGDADVQDVDAARVSYEALGMMGGPPADCEQAAARVPGDGGPIPVRIYRPRDPGTPIVLIWFHSGGWTIGSLDLADGTCRALCDRAGVTVVSVGYRLAPEHPYPAALDDAHRVVDWVSGPPAELGVSPRGIAVGGASAGGNIAAVIARERRDIVDAQVLVSPVLDATMSSASYVENGTGKLLTARTMAWFVGNYLGSGDRTDPRVSPLLAEDLSGLPPAVVVSAEHDPLRDEAAAYTERLRAAGVTVHHRCYDGMIHEFQKMSSLTSVADDALAFAAMHLREALT